MTASRYASFTSHDSKRWGPGKQHVVDRRKPETVLGERVSICGYAYGIATVKEFKRFVKPASSEDADRRCKHCIAFLIGKFEKVQT